VERWLDVRAKRGISAQASIICALEEGPATAYVRAFDAADRAPRRD
jgi:hypothetical protein